MEVSKKPSLGLKPQYMWDMERQQSICEAIKRYLYDGETAIPIEWVEEYNELVAKLKGGLK